MSSVQTFVGLAAGILSITGAFVAFFKPAPDKGELVAIVQDARTEKAVSDAMIEILTPRDALITTLQPPPLRRFYHCPHLSPTLAN